MQALLATKLRILDIALEYGFGYEQSHNKAFKDEFGISPNNLRRNGEIVSIRPPLQLYNIKEFPNSILFAPEIVMLPQILQKKLSLTMRNL